MNHLSFFVNVAWDAQSFFEKFRDITLRFLEIFPSFWNYALFSVEKNPITIGNLILGLSFVIVGYASIRLVVHYFESRVLSRLDIDISHRSTIKVFLFYFLITLLFLFTLHLIEVPLAFFTVIGGALALGLGFGARNIMNNFISGIVIVLEHPIRQGDVVQFDNLIGSIEHIGFRATTLRTVDNTHIIVPNSSFLEQNILNWTLSDRVIRCRVSVGLAYGSDPQRAEDVLLQVAEDHERVLTYNRNQKPIVIFEDFGDNALKFSLYFWIAVERTMDTLRVSSDIRHKIAEALKKENLVIAYPQRDIHIKTPVSVDVLNK